jgi:hypothetical protein
MGIWWSRRRLLGAVAAGFGVAFAPEGGKAGEVGTLDYCYWRKAQGPTCRSDGKLYEY